MVALTEEKLLKDLQVMKSKGYYEKLQKLYKKLPVTSCNGCGECCKDSPIITYGEFLFIYDYFILNKKFTKDEKVEIYKNAIRHFTLGLISANYYCAFLNEDKKCMIYEVSPLNCKRWGIQGEETFLKDLNTDHERNKEYQMHYGKQGVHIPDEVINRVTTYCNNVKIEKNPYNILGRDFDNFYFKELKPIILTFKDIEKQARDWSVGNYLVYSLLGKRAYTDRINVVREYQNGDTEAIERYINLLKVEELIK